MSTIQALSVSLRAQIVVCVRWQRAGKGQELYWANIFQHCLRTESAAKCIVLRVSLTWHVLVTQNMTLPLPALSPPRC